MFEMDFFITGSYITALTLMLGVVFIALRRYFRIKHPIDKQ
jgi:hypothetical protein